MNRFAYIIGIASLLLALIISELLLFDNFMFLSVVFVVFIVSLRMATKLLRYTNGFINAFKNNDQPKLKQLIHNSTQSYIFNQHSINDLKLFTNVILQDYTEVEQTFSRFHYLNDIEKHHTSFIYQLYFLFKNDYREFLKLKEADKKTENIIIEDNIITKVPGVIHFDRRIFKIDLEVLNDIYLVYQNSDNFEGLQVKRYRDNIYNYIKEKALYYYLFNTEQHELKRKFLENSEFIFDEFWEDEQ